METQNYNDDHYDRMKQLKEFDESKAGVKGLSDSGITSIPRIFVHPPESLSDLVKKSQPSISIPVIDLSGLNSPSDRPNLVDQVKQAAKEWGFFQVINHGIQISVVNDTVSAVKAFHELPNETKSKHYRRLTDRRGVMYVSNLDIYRSEAASWRDSIQVYEVPAGEDEVAAVPEICRGEIMRWFERGGDVAESVMELLCEGLGLHKERFKELTFLGSRMIAGQYYPYCPEPDRTVGFSSHSDASFLTVLIQNQIAGLQIKHEGVWVDVKPHIGAMVVNVGDFLQIVSNDEYKSVQHRVLANSCKEPRISVVMFFGPLKWRDDNYFGPLPELLSLEKPAVYRDFTKEEYVENHYKRKIGNKTLIESFKIL